MSEVVIQVENLGKRYRIAHRQQRQRYLALRDVLADRTKSIVRRLWSAIRRTLSSDRRPLSSGPPSQEDFWALEGVSFEVRQGESVGIIGRNGAGKSTLLKLLSRITEPTTGRMRIRGRVASLLEVGTGFHPELTGRENIYLNGAVLGMHRSEITQKFDEIVAFAQVDKFLETPVKRYSSGMYVRLAFSVAAHLEPEILVVDEVLAVGDAAFQKKCLGKMGDVVRGGRTVLFVSHNMSSIQALTERSLLLHEGRVKCLGATAAVIDQYLLCLGNNRGYDFQNVARYSDQLGNCIRICRIEPVVVEGGCFCFGQDVLFDVTLESKQHYSGLRFGVTISDLGGSGIMTTTTPSEINISAASKVTYRMRLRQTNLAPGTYVLSLSVGKGDLYGSRVHYDVVDPGAPFSVASVAKDGKPVFNWMKSYGSLVFPQSGVEISKLASYELPHSS